MIPLQVKIKGLMRYRDEQVADFTDGSLISICGENGAGKSTIFDAITFALYGHALRVKANVIQELISEDQDYFSVEFDFEADGNRFRVQRVRGGRATFGLQRWDEESQTWLTVPGTDSVRGLDAAIARIIKLPERAFRASYLLGQDAATAFLDLDPGPRFQLISGLIDLEEYERLAKAAGDGARRESTILRDRIEKLLTYVDVTSDALDRVRDETEAALAREAEAKQQAAAAAVRAGGARTYARLLAEIADLEARLSEFDALIGRRPEIEALAERYRQLDAQVATVARVESEIAGAARAEQALAETDAEAKALQIEALSAAATATREAADAAAAALQAADAARGEADRTERDARNFRDLAKVVLDARTLAADCAASIERYESELSGLAPLEAEAAQVEALRAALYPLAAWRDALREVETLAAEDPEKAVATLKKQVTKAEAELTTAEAAVEAAAKAFEAARSAAEHESHELRTLEAHLEHRRDSAKEPTCSHCGQPIDPQRAQEEIEHVSTQIDACRARLAAATKARNAAAAEHEAALATSKQAAEALQKLRNDLQATGFKAEQLLSARTAGAEREAAFRAVAPKSLAAEVKPTAGGIDAALALHADTDTRAAELGRSLNALHKLQGELDSERRRQEQAVAVLAEATSAAGDRLSEVEAAAATHAAALTALQEQERRLDAARTASEAATGAARAADTAHRQAAERARQLELLAVQHRRDAENHRRGAAALVESSEASLRDRALSAPATLLTELRAEQQSLSAAPAEAAALQSALQQYGPIEGARTAKHSECDHLPADQRIPLSQAEAYLHECEAAAEVAGRDARVAVSKATLLDERLTQKTTIEAELDRAEERTRLLRKLGALLGKTGLQGLLVTEALQTITSHANSFLQRLTGGSLQLELAKGEANDELEIKAIDTSSMRSRRNIQTLSGSQKFRCAVGLAFGIGQYMGAGGMRSIMIDEGFGGLDESGQRQMVEELKHLSTHMDKVIVVSHLEAFRDRDNFPSQIHVTKDGSGSSISVVRY